MASVPEEEELVKTRMLLFEQRPYNRLLKRCSTLFKSTQVLNSPDTVGVFCEELELDFKSFESILIRTQLVHNTNKRECERYEQEKGNILRTAESARGVIVSLRETLAVSQMEKENKLVYDAIATDILSRPGLKARQEQQGNLDRLNKEIAELESERDEYRLVLAARRDRFSQIVDQLEKMWAQIKEDKDEQDRREGMSEEEEEEEEEEEGEEVEDLVRATPVPELHTPSNASATPKPEARSRSPSILVTRPSPGEKEEGEDTEGTEDIELTDPPPEQNRQKEEGEEDNDEMDISQG